MSSAGVSQPASVSSVHVSGQASRFNRKAVILSLVLLLATAAVYYPVHWHPFVNFDDNDYVTDNPQVQAGLTWSTVKWACTSTFAANWHPLTWLSHAADCEIFGLNPAGPHDVNVALHAIDAVLLFWVLLWATGFAGRSFMVAALFALHPINVESVAWIAERKTMLCTLFFLLALGAYRWYAREPKVSRYCLVALLFAVGLTAKSQIITLPFMLLLWDYWPLERFSLPFDQRLPVSTFPVKRLSWLLLEKVPLLLITAASAVVTMKAQHGARSWFPRIDRAGNGVLSYGLYMKKMVWPSRLAPLYPHPGTSLNWWHVTISAVVLMAITALVLWQWRHRYLTVGWCWFLGGLVPMLGIVQVGVQAMADRYAYISFIGLFIMVCWSVAEFAQHRHAPRLLLPAVSVAVLVALAVVTRHQLNYWQTNEGLWAHTVSITKNNWLADDELGGVLARQGRISEAMPLFHSAIALNPEDTTSNMGIALYDLHRQDYAGALGHFRVIIKNEGEKGKAVVLHQAYEGMAKAYHGLGDQIEEQDSLEAAKRYRH